MYCSLTNCFSSFLRAPLSAGIERFPIEFAMSSNSSAPFYSFAGFAPTSENTRPPSVIGSANGSDMYAVHMENTNVYSAPAIIYKYSTSNNYISPVAQVEISNASSGKWTALYDSIRNYIYLFTFANTSYDNLTSWYNFTTINTHDWSVKQIALTKVGANGDGVHYPHLTTIGTTLFAAWTTDKGNPYYGSIQIMKSTDAGASWSTLSGTNLTLPVDSSTAGPTQSLILPDEVGGSNWLANMIGYNGSIHIMYTATHAAGQTNVYRSRYARFSQSGVLETQKYGPFSGTNLVINGQSGFFVDAGSRLFAVGTFDSKAVVVLVSNDSGLTWQDYAFADMPGGLQPYGLGGYHMLSGNGEIVGSVLGCPVDCPRDGTYRTYTFKLKVF